MRSGAHRLMAGVARHFLSPLALLEMTALVVAAALGWALVAQGILAWHVLRMAAMAWRGRRKAPA